MPASPARPAPFPCIVACQSRAGPCACHCVATGFCPVIANKHLSHTEVSLLTLWLQKGQLIPDLLQPVFTNVPSKKKENKPRPLLGHPKAQENLPNKHFHQFLERRHRRQPLISSPSGKPAELPAPWSTNLLLRLAKSCKMFPITSTGQARFVCRSSSLGTSGTLGSPELQISSSWLWGSTDPGCSHPTDTSQGASGFGVTMGLG